jgi:hypothetical protein
MPKIKPVGKVKPNKWSPIYTKKIEKPKRDYDEYLVAECLNRKLNSKEYAGLYLRVEEGDEVWSYDDNKVPLCGEIGIVVIRNGKIIQKKLMGLH